MIQIRAVFFFLFIPLICFAELKDEFASLETDLDFIIDGKVNVISGAFIDGGTDIVMPSIFPLSAGRSSVPFSYVSGNMWEGWHLNFCGSCASIINDKIDYRAEVRDENGTPLVFLTPYKNRGSFTKIGKSYAKGETNLGREIIGGKTSVRNYHALIDKKGESVILKTGSGLKKTYKRVSTDRFIRHDLDRIDNPSGFSLNLIKNHTNQWVKKCYSADAQEMGSIVYDRTDSSGLPHGGRACLYTSDGRHVEYRFNSHYNTKYDDPKQCYGLLNYVGYSPRHWVQYAYDEHTPYHRERCTLKMEPKNHYVEMAYYTPGEKNEVWGVSSSNLRHWEIIPFRVEPYSRLSDRVKTLKQPALYNAKVETKRFLYHFFEDKKKFNGGRTDVYDHYNHLSSYSYNKDHRPTEIRHYHGGAWSYVRDIRHRLYWGDPKKDQDGFLSARVVYCERSSEYKARSLEYDERGNIKKETFFGNLTGQNATRVLFDEYGQPTNTTESYSKTRVYKDAELNNLDEEVHENGLKISFVYQPNTDRITRKHVSGAGFTQTTSYSYHPCGSISEICEKDRLTELVTRHVPKLSQPCYGFDEVKTELYKQGFTEVLLKKILFKEYDSLGKPKEIEVYDADGAFAYSESYEYDEIGCCTKEVRRTKEVIERWFDALGSLEKEIGPEGLYIKTFEYDAMNRLTQESVTLQDGTVWETRYGYNAIGGMEYKIDPYGNRTDYENDRYNRPHTTNFPEVDGVRPFEKREYDIFGNVTLFRDRNGNVTRTTYNSYDKPVSIKYPDGNCEYFEYNIDGTLKSITDRSGLKTIFDVDCLGRILKKTILDPENPAIETYQYDASLLRSITSPNGTKTVFDYDGAGRKISETAEGSLTTFAYDSLGRLSRTSRYDKEQLVSTSVEIFDVSDRVVEKWIEDANGDRFLYEKFGYDPLGNKNLEVKGRAVTTYEYDGLNRPIKKTDPMGYVTTWIYSKDVHRETRIDPNGVATVQTFDALQRLILQEQYDQETLLSSVSYRYDYLDNIIEESHQVIGSDAKPYVLLRQYDKMNRLKVLTEPLAKQTRHTYTPLGKIKTTLKPDGVLLSYTYDARGNLTSLYSDDRSINYTYTYDLMGNTLSLSDSRTEVIRTYTARCELKTETYLGQTFTYDHDDLDQVIKITFPDQSIVEYEYGALGIKTVKRNGYEHTYFEIDDFGNTIRERLIDGTFRVMAYDPLGRLRNISHPDCTLGPLKYDCMGNLIQRGEDLYTYDKLNQLSSEAGTFYHTHLFDSIHNPRQRDDEPLKISELNQIDSDSDYTYTYDINGNLKTKMGPSNSWIFTYDHLDRMIMVETNNETYHYIYDGFHRRLIKKSPKRQESYWFVGDNEVASLVNNSLTSFRALGIGLGAEIGAAVLIEFNGRTLPPHYDQSGNIIRLGRETCTYSAFGETTSTLSIPWSYASKRFDPETGFTYFGRRYYDPTLSRWTSCDPLGFTAGINLYAYVTNGPLTRFDEYGLFEDNSQVSHLNGSEVLFYHGFEAEHGYRSSWFSLNLLDIADRGIGFINGILNRKKNCRASGEYLSKLSGGGNIQLVHNATHGTVTDSLESVYNLNGIATHPSLHLIRSWDHFFENSSPDAMYLQFAHSQGAIHLKNALLAYPPELRKRILVVAIAPAAYIDPKLCADVVHYRVPALNDPVPRIDSLGEQIAKDTIITLQCHPDASCIDHSFNSPTYKDAIKFRLQNYIQSGGKAI